MLAATAVCVMFAELAYITTIQLPQQSAQTDPTPKPDAAQRGDPLPPPGDYDVVATRPLFMEDRKPYRSPATEGTAKLTAPGESANRLEALLLSAVVITPQQQLALVQPGPAAPLHILKPGDAIAGWTVQTIQPYSVALARGSEERILELEVRPGP